MKEDKKGWWICFYQFADKLIDLSSDNRELCMSVLYDNYVMPSDIYELFDSTATEDVAVDNLLRQYCERLLE